MTQHKKDLKEKAQGAALILTVRPFFSRLEKLACSLALPATLRLFHLAAVR